VIGISEVTGFPEMMDGRGQDAPPLVHGGILARRRRDDDLRGRAAHGISCIDVVVVNLYPFVKAAANPDTPFDRSIEEIDIGGQPRARGGEEFSDVLVVVSPDDYPEVLEALDAPGGASREFRFALGAKAFAHTGNYDSAIASTLATHRVRGDTFRRGVRARGRSAHPPC
jgi:phosphoribosylaminoimidazolecarboxamide formyltransferase/IMP cyclohydrolase